MRKTLPSVMATLAETIIHDAGEEDGEMGDLDMSLG